MPAKSGDLMLLFPVRLEKRPGTRRRATSLHSVIYIRIYPDQADINSKMLEQLPYMGIEKWLHRL